jgi:hypothetical protein
MAPIFAVFSGAPAGLCPDLSGTYECRMYTKTQTVTVAVYEAEGTVHYRIDGYDIPADGRARPLPGDGDYRNGRLTAACQDGKLIMNLAGELFQNGKRAGRIRMRMFRSKGEDGALQLRNEGVIENGGQELPFTGDGRCRLLP